MDNKFKNNDIIYYQLDGGFFKKIKKFLENYKKEKEIKNTVKTTKSEDVSTEIKATESEDVSTEIKAMVKSTIKTSSEMLKVTNSCVDIDTRPTCNITDEQIDEITQFLTHKLPKCKHLDISLKNIQEGQIIGSGSFGYTFKIKDKIIKIILCDKENENLMNYEIDLHKYLMDTKQKKYFIELYGYINKNNETKKYTYYDINTSKSECKFDTDKNDCFIYLFLEAGTTDLQKELLKSKDKTKILTEITNKFYDLLNFYKVSSELIKKYNLVFIHSDIKLENIVCVETADKKDYNLKLIDFGISLLSKTFSASSGYSPLYYYYYMGKKESNPVITSPVYDVFCLVLSYVQFLLPKELSTYTTTTYEYNKLIKEMNLNILESNEMDIKLKMYKLICIGWLFQGGINDKIYIINKKKISCNSIDSIQKMYENMDKIIKTVCNCTTEKQIFEIYYSRKN
jgi:hypothetical protein